MNATSTSQRAYDHVKRGILAGEYAPGQMLSEGGVAESVGVSRTPVREAMLRLEVEGFLTLYPKKGALVVPVGVDEAREVLEARALIDTWAAPRAYARRDELVAPLTDLLAAMRTHAASGDVAAFTEADRAYHETIVEAAGNAVLARVYRSLRDRQLCIVAATMRVSKDRMRRAVEDHEQLIELLDGDRRDEFVELIGVHVNRAKESLSGGSGDHA